MLNQGGLGAMVFDRGKKDWEKNNTNEEEEKRKRGKGGVLIKFGRGRFNGVGGMGVRLFSRSCRKKVFTWAGGGGRGGKGGVCPGGP